MINKTIGSGYILTILLFGLNVMLLSALYKQQLDNKELVGINQKDRLQFKYESEDLNYTIDDLKEALEISGNYLRDIALTNSSGEETKLFSLISDTTILYVNTLNSCKSCLFEELKEIKELSKGSIYEVVSVMSFEKFREFKAYVYANNLEDLLIYNTHHSIIENYSSQAHLLLLTDSSLVVKKCCVLDKTHPELNKWFFDLILRNFKNTYSDSCSQDHLEHHSH